MKRLKDEFPGRRVWEVVDDATGEVVGTDEEDTTPEAVAETEFSQQLGGQLNALQGLARGTGTMTAAQLTVAVRILAEALEASGRLHLRRFD